MSYTLSPGGLHAAIAMAEQEIPTSMFYQPALLMLRDMITRVVVAERAWDVAKWGDTGQVKYAAMAELDDARRVLYAMAGDTSVKETK